MKIEACGRLAVAGSAVAALSGCALAIMINLEPEQRAVLFAVPPDRATLYAYRDDASEDGLPLAFLIDGITREEAGPSKFVFYEMNPGEHTIASLDADSGAMSLDIEVGKSYFVRQEIVCDAAQPHLHLRADSASAGRAKVRALYAAGKVPATIDAPATKPLACPSPPQDSATLPLSAPL